MSTLLERAKDEAEQAAVDKVKWLEAERARDRTRIYNAFKAWFQVEPDSQSEWNVITHEGTSYLYRHSSAHGGSGFAIDGACPHCHKAAYSDRVFSNLLGLGQAIEEFRAEGFTPDSVHLEECEPYQLSLADLIPMEEEELKTIPRTPEEDLGQFLARYIRGVIEEVEAGESYQEYRGQ